MLVKNQYTGQNISECELYHHIYVSTMLNELKNVLK